MMHQMHNLDFAGTRQSALDRRMLIRMGMRLLPHVGCVASKDITSAVEQINIPGAKTVLEHAGYGRPVI